MEEAGLRAVFPEALAPVMVPDLARGPAADLDMAPDPAKATEEEDRKVHLPQDREAWVRAQGQGVQRIGKCLWKAAAEEAKAARGWGAGQQRRRESAAAGTRETLRRARWPWKPG